MWDLYQSKDLLSEDRIIQNEKNELRGDSFLHGKLNPEISQIISDPLTKRVKATNQDRNRGDG
jgi:hypothetical protein